MPVANDVLSVARAKVGLGETPPQSNHNAITAWYGADGPWCAMFVSWVLAHAGFTTDGGETLKVPGVVQTTTRGWSYVPYLLNNFRSAGLADDHAEPGKIATYDWDHDGVPDHTGIVESLSGDGTFVAIEGNHNDKVERVTRHPWEVEAFCIVPYDGVHASGTPTDGAAATPTFPGYCSSGSADNATLQVQQRLSARGWNIGVDGVFGPETDRCVRLFQQQEGLTVDGIVGPQTWTALWTAPVTAQ